MEGQQGGARETDQGMALKNFKVCPRFASFSNLRAVALNSCKYLSNVQLTGVCVHEGGKKEETGKRRGNEGMKGEEGGEQAGERIYWK